MENKDIEMKIEGILFAAGEPVPIQRLSMVLEMQEDVIRQAALRLKNYYAFERRGIRLVLMDNLIQLCSSPEHADDIRRVLEKRKPPQLTPTALEVLAVVAYFQPVTRAYIESVRGVDSSYTVGVLQERGLIEKTGNLEVPGRPALFCTTDLFLRTFGIESLEDLPPLPEIETDSDSRAKIESAIEALTKQEEDHHGEETQASQPEDNEESQAQHGDDVEEEAIHPGE